MQRKVRRVFVHNLREANSSLEQYEIEYNVENERKSLGIDHVTFSVQAQMVRLSRPAIDRSIDEPFIAVHERLARLCNEGEGYSLLSRPHAMPVVLGWVQILIENRREKESDGTSVDSVARNGVCCCFCARR